VLSIEPDAVYAGMWRVRRSDGTLTDMVNKTRAREVQAWFADDSSTNNGKTYES
jgi:hypothetical protein